MRATPYDRQGFMAYLKVRQRKHAAPLRAIACFYRFGRGESASFSRHQSSISPATVSISRIPAARSSFAGEFRQIRAPQVIRRQQFG
jgi:hypothetical protein